MTTTPEAPPLPLPSPDPVTQFFWDGVARHELWIQRCQNCGHYLHYPKVLCRYCQSDDLAGEQVSGQRHALHVDDRGAAVPPVLRRPRPLHRGHGRARRATGSDVHDPARRLHRGRPADRYAGRGHVRRARPRAHAPVLPPGIRGVDATGQRVAIVGCGYSHVGRNTGLSIDDHMIQATKAALADAGSPRATSTASRRSEEPLNDAGCSASPR